MAARKPKPAPNKRRAKPKPAAPQRAKPRKKKSANPRGDDGLTGKMRLFVAEYLLSHNASDAARKAGYSAKTAHYLGAENLKKPVIQAAIQAAEADRFKRLHMGADEVMAELAAIGRSRITDMVSYEADGVVRYVPSATLTPAQQGTIRKVKTTLRTIPTGADGPEIIETKVELELHPKIEALEKIGKHLKLWADRLEHTGKDGGPIETSTKIDLSGCSPEELATMADVMLRANQRDV